MRHPVDPQNGYFDDALVCLNVWLGNQEAASEHLARWEPIWRTLHAYGFRSEAARYESLAHSLACFGRRDDALTELEALINEGYNIDWRLMAVDPAYDGIRGDPRFKAVSDKFKAADAAARDRFRARPGLNDADIESLGM